MNFVSPHVREEDVLVEQVVERGSSVGQTFDVILVERDEAVETQQISRGLGSNVVSLKVRIRVAFRRAYKDQYRLV